MSLYDLQKEMLVKIIEKMERPMYILKVRRRGSSRHHAHDNFIGPFYNEDEIGEYFKKRFNLTSFDVNYFKKHNEHYSHDDIYELHKLTL